jgi:hypothetical protein
MFERSAFYGGPNFSSAEVKAMFVADPATFVRKADANWPRLK